MYSRISGFGIKGDAKIHLHQFLQCLQRVNTSKMNNLLNQRRNRFQLLNWQLQLNQQQNVNNMLMVQVIQNHRRVQRRRRERTVWVRPWLQRRLELGQYSRLLEELRVEDVRGFRNFLRLDPDMFQELLRRMLPRLTKTDTFCRKALSPGLKLAITLRYLASGDNYHSLMYGFRVPHNTISKLIPEVCEAIIAEYAEEVIEGPTTEQQWRAISQQFSRRWQFEHCLGALDGKHIAIRCPTNAGSEYYNYKGFHSIILMALVDGDYKFSWVDVGSNGSAGDAQVFNRSELKECMDDQTLGVPAPEPLPHDDRDMPFFIVGDDAFALRTWLMKPFSKRNLTDIERIFNYRLSRARRIVENAFGILAHRYQCLLTTLRQKPPTVVSIVLACICLHNLMRVRYPAQQNADVDQEDQDHNVAPGAWRQNNPLVGIYGARGNRMTVAAKHQRQYLSAYYSSDAGSVPWQMNMI